MKNLLFASLLIMSVNAKSLADMVCISYHKPFNYLYFGGMYDTQKKSPVYTHYVLTMAQIKADIASRKNEKFWRDDSLFTVTTKDYTRSGYDRGHMTPAEDMHYSQKAMHESFSMANISPQTKELNEVSWRILENAIRDSATAWQGASIWTGPLYRYKIGRFNGIEIPSHFFKVACNKKVCHAFVYENIHTQNKNVDAHKVDIKALKKETFIDFK